MALSLSIGGARLHLCEKLNKASRLAPFIEYGDGRLLALLVFAEGASDETTATHS
jgi:hypothetical protein